MKDGNLLSLWTVCGARRAPMQVSNVGTNKGMIETRSPAVPDRWFQYDELEKIETGEYAGAVYLPVKNFVSTGNNVYAVNVVVREKCSTGSCDSKQSAVYEMMTLQMKTPRYEEPELSNTDYAVIIGVSAGLGGCIIIFLVVGVSFLLVPRFCIVYKLVQVAVIVKRKRAARAALKVRQKK